MQAWVSKNPHGTVVRRDLAAIEIPAIDAKWFCANYTPNESRTEQQNGLLKLSREFIVELLDADEYVIGMPMHNWGRHPASNSGSIKSSFHGAGVLSDKSCTFVIAAGRHHGPGSERAAENYLVPWLRTLFGYLGVKDLRFVVADGSAEIAKGNIGRETFLAPHIEAIRGLLAEGHTEIKGPTCRTSVRSALMSVAQRKADEDHDQTH